MREWESESCGILMGFMISSSEGCYSQGFETVPIQKEHPRTNKIFERIEPNNDNCTRRYKPLANAEIATINSDKREDGHGLKGKVDMVIK